MTKRSTKRFHQYFKSNMYKQALKDRNQNTKSNMSELRLY